MTDKPTQADDVETWDYSFETDIEVVIAKAIGVGKGHYAPSDWDAENAANAVKEYLNENHPRQPNQSLEKLERVKEVLRRIRNIEKPMSCSDSVLAKYQWKLTVEQMAEMADEALAMLEEG